MTIKEDPTVFAFRSELVTFAVNTHKKVTSIRKGCENEKSLLLELAEESKQSIQKIIQDTPEYMLPQLCEIAESWSVYMDKAIAILSKDNPKILDARTYLGGPEREEFRARR